MFPRITIFLQSLCILLFLQNTIFCDEIYQSSVNDKFLTTIYTTKEGLPQNTPTSIVQTKDGYIWLGTFGGLARFDGVKFTVFTTSNTPELINNRITALYEDHNNILWIGTEDGDIMNYQNSIFSLTKQSVGNPLDTTISAFYVDQNDTLWIGTAGELRTYNIKNKQFTSFSKEQLLKKPLVSKDGFHIDKFSVDTEGNLWIASNGGLIRFRDGIFTNFNTDDNLPDNYIVSILSNPAGGLWISTNKIVGSYKNGVFTQLAKIDYDGDFSKLAINQENHLFFSSKKLLYEVKDNEVQTFDISVLKTDGIRPLFFDKQDNLWIGANNGLFQLKRRHIKVFASISDKIWFGTSAIIESPADKSVWIACGKNLLHWHNGTFKSFPIPNEAGYFTTLGVDKNNVLWVGTYNGIYKFENNKFTILAGTEKKQVAPIYFDNDGNLWFGVRIGGLYKLQNGEFKSYTVVKGLANNWISHISQDRKGVMWIGTKGGLSRLENDQFTNFSTDDGLQNNNVRDVYEDEDGTLWIGTYGGGISRFRDGKFISITANNGLAEDIASRLLLDDNGIFWVLGNQGVYTVSRNSLNDFADGKTKRVYCTIYDEKDGMEVGEGSGGNQPAGWKTSDGKLWFPMIRGGITIDPNIRKHFPPPVYIEAVTLNNQKLDVRNKVEIQPNQNNLEITYTGINFTKPEQIQFRYKLEGFDKDWQDVGNRHVAFYPYLPPGTYTFKVIAIDSSGTNSEKDASLQIIVHAPFWQTWWFYSLVLFAIFLLIVAIYQSRLNWLKRKRLQQEEFSRQLIYAHESERSRIAGELHDSLGQNLLIIRNWTLLILKQIPEKNKHRKQLEEISEVASQSLDETRTISRNLRPQHLQRFGLTSTIQNMIRQVEESTEIRCHTEIENIDKFFSSEEELSVFRIIQESVNNIIKHSNAKNAKIVVKQIAGRIDFTNANDKIEILISDDGKGFDLKALNKNSFGLNNISQRVALLGGKYSIKSNVGEGTQINILLNLK